MISCLDIDDIQAEVALEEWSSGQFRPFHSLFQVAGLINSRIEEVSSMIHKFKDGRPKMWNEFCAKVHLCASQNRVDSLVLQRPLCHLSAKKGELYNVRPERGSDDDNE
jgi:hypothetical protein